LKFRQERASSQSVIHVKFQRELARVVSLQQNSKEQFEFQELDANCGFLEHDQSDAHGGGNTQSE
jgi:hypothetical protein